jgi:hypothetical protein
MMFVFISAIFMGQAKPWFASSNVLFTKISPQKLKFGTINWYPTVKTRYETCSIVSIDFSGNPLIYARLNSILNNVTL